MFSLSQISNVQHLYATVICTALQFEAPVHQQGYAKSIWWSEMNDVSPLNQTLGPCDLAICGEVRHLEREEC